MSSPIRIQLSRAKGWRMPPNTVKVDRSTKWGNPFPVISGTSTHMGQTKTIWQVGTWDGPAIWFRDSAIEALELSVQAYRAWVTRPSNAPLMTEAKNSLHGKNLACWCKPGSPCHADVLLELANATPAAQREGASDETTITGALLAFNIAKPNKCKAGVTNVQRNRNAGGMMHEIQLDSVRKYRNPS